VAADQRILNAKASITNIGTEVENDHWESVRKLAQAHDVSAKMVHTTLHKGLSSIGGRLGGCPICQTSILRRSE
jgi:hypothetical protein